MAFTFSSIVVCFVSFKCHGGHWFADYISLAADILLTWHQKTLTKLPVDNAHISIYCNVADGSFGIFKYMLVLFSGIWLFFCGRFCFTKA